MIFNNLGTYLSDRNLILKTWGNPTTWWTWAKTRTRMKRSKERKIRQQFTLIENFAEYTAMFMSFTVLGPSSNDSPPLPQSQDFLTQG